MFLLSGPNQRAYGEMDGTRRFATLSRSGAGFQILSWLQLEHIKGDEYSSQIPKIEDICACSTATSGQITKRIARWDSAHQVGLISDSNSLADCRWRTSKVVNIAVINEYSRRKYSELLLLLQIESHENRELNSPKPHPRTIQIRIEYNNIKKCRPLTETMVEATSSHPLSPRQSRRRHMIISWRCRQPQYCSWQFVQQLHYPCR